MGLKTLVLELNELCPPLLDRFIAEGHLPNFEKLKQGGATFVTHTDDESLEPWVQWVSFHTGLTQDAHQITELDQGHILKQPSLWDKLAEDGQTSLVFGAMNAGPSTHEKVTIVPDPWSKNVPASQPEFGAFHKFIAKQVAEHSNPDDKITLSELTKFGIFCLRNGLSLQTVYKAVTQILSEKVSSRDLYWKRACLLDDLLWDVFSTTVKRQDPQNAFYFGNSVAFLQHRYWRHLMPEVYKVKPSEQEMSSYGDAVLHGYKRFDRIIGKALQLLGKDGALVLVTALSQEENLRYEEQGGKFVYRARNFDKVLDFIGAPTGISVEPVMTHEAWATCQSVTDAEALVERFQDVRLKQSNAPMFGYREAKGKRVMFWCDLEIQIPDDTVMVDTKTGREVAFFDLFASVGQVNNSQHNRDGAFWIYRSPVTLAASAEKIDLTDATRMVLEVARA